MGDVLLSILVTNFPKLFTKLLRVTNFRDVLRSILVTNFQKTFHQTPACDYFPLQDLGREDDAAAELKADHVWQFPLEAHQNLVQELGHVFSADILLSFGCGSGCSLFGALLSNMRVIGASSLIMFGHSFVTHCNLTFNSVSPTCAGRRLALGVLAPSCEWKHSWILTRSKKVWTRGVGQGRTPTTALSFSCIQSEYAALISLLSCVLPDYWFSTLRPCSKSSLNW